MKISRNHPAGPLIAGILIYLAFDLLCVVTWMSPTNYKDHPGCFGYLGVEWVPDEWNRPECNNGSSSTEWSPGNKQTTPEILAAYTSPQDYPSALQSAIRRLPVYPHGKQLDFELISHDSRWNWDVYPLPHIILNTPVYTVTAFTTTDKPYAIRAFYKDTLRQNNWDFLYSATAGQDAGPRLSSNMCGNDDWPGTSNSPTTGCRLAFVSWRDWQGT